MKVVGIDLAGSEKNDTGFCVLLDNGRSKRVGTCLLKTDKEIKLQCDIIKPDLVAIDAPLSRARNAFMRAADEELREYGALPQNLRGMTCLVDRGVRLGEELKKDYKVIEVFNTATAKILGFYDKRDVEMQKKLAQMLEGDVKNKIMKKDELDAVSAALTGYLFIQGKAAEVGDDEGKIVIPNI